MPRAGWGYGHGYLRFAWSLAAGRCALFAKIAIRTKYAVQHIKKFAYIKKKHYLCSVKQEIKKYLESETEVNKRSVHISKIFTPILISLIIIGLGLVIFGLYMALTI